MTKQYLKFILLLSALLPAVLPAEVFTADAMRKEMRDAAVTGTFDAIVLDAMRNEHEAFQVIFRAPAQGTDGNRVAVSSLRSESGVEIPAEALTLRRAHYILCDKHVSRPGWYPDALLPYHGEAFEVAAGQLQSIYIDIAVPADIPAGTYTGIITTEQNGDHLQAPLTLRVRDITLPEAPSFQSAFPIWGDEQLTAPFPDLKPDSPEYHDYYERFYWFMTGYRMPPDDIPVPLDSPEAERFLRHPAINSFRIPYNPDQPERFQEICAALREKGLLERGYVYTLDEPARTQYAMCAAYADRLHELVPDARFLLTVNNGNSPELKGHVDIWCPILAGYDPKYFQPLQPSNSVWWYSCVYPQQPYPTYLVNDDAISPRILSWLQAKYKVEGVLYWALNIWKKWNPEAARYEARDIWSDPLAFPAANGDGYLVYPGATPQDDPVPSWRLEMIRQGNEDFDMLTLLREEVTRTALRFDRGDYNGDVRIAELVNRIARSLVQFDRDPAALSGLRVDVLDEIEALTSGVPALWEASAPEGETTTGSIISWTLTASPASRVEITAYQAGGEEAVATQRDGNRYRWELPVNRPLRLRARIDQDGKSSVYHREYRTRDYVGESREVFNWNMPEVVESLRYYNVSNRILPGSVMREFVFDTTGEFPNVRLKLEGDTSPFRWIVVKAANYGSDTGEALLKFHGPADVRDGAALNVPAGGVPITLAFPFNADGATPESAYDQLEIWMFQGKPENTLVIESITLATDMPAADNLY